MSGLACRFDCHLFMVAVAVTSLLDISPPDGGGLNNLAIHLPIDSYMIIRITEYLIIRNNVIDYN